MSKPSSKLSVLQIVLIATGFWAMAAGTGLYMKLSSYSAPSVEEIRSSDVLIKALAPSLAFQCYQGDESKMGADLVCEDKIILQRDRMIFLIKYMQIFLLVFFTAPLSLWILHMAAPKLFFFLPPPKKD